MLLVAIVVSSYSSIEAIDLNHWFGRARSGASQVYDVLTRKKVWVPIVAATALCLLKGMISYGEKSLNEDIKSFEEMHNEIYEHVGSLNISSEKFSDERISEIYQALNALSRDTKELDLKAKGYLGELPSVGFIGRVHDLSPQEAEKYLSRYRPSLCQRLALLVLKTDCDVIIKKHENIIDALSKSIQAVERIGREPFEQAHRDELIKCLGNFSGPGGGPLFKPAKKN